MVKKGEFINTFRVVRIYKEMFTRKISTPKKLFTNMRFLLSVVMGNIFRLCMSVASHKTVGESYLIRQSVLIASLNQDRWELPNTCTCRENKCLFTHMHAHKNTHRHTLLR